MTHTPAGTASNSKSKWIAVALSLLGVTLLFFYREGLRAQTPNDIAWFLKIVAAQTPLYLAAVWLSVRDKESRLALAVVLTFAALFRLSILFAPPYLSDDIYRYVWDGRVQASGINPYRYIPADQTLLRLRDENIYPKINRRDSAPTMYPPVAESVYFLTTRVSESVTWMKATMVGFEAIAIWAIVQLLGSFGLARQRVMIYAWHPLAIWEFAGSGHLDAIMIAFVALALLARRRKATILTGVALACATLVKFFPGVLSPPLYKCRDWKMPLAFMLTILFAYLPYLGVGPVRVLGYLPGYAAERGMVSGEQFLILSTMRRLLNVKVPTPAYAIFAGLLLIALAIWQMQTHEHERDGFVRSGLVLATAFMVLLSPHFSWYFAWLIPFLCFMPSVAVLYLTLASFALYLTWLGDAPDRVLALKLFIYLPFALLVVIAMWRQHRESKRHA